MGWVRPTDAIDAAHAVRRRMPETGTPVPFAVTDYPLHDYSTGLLGDQVVRFLEDHRARPFAAWVSFPDPHPPFEAPAAYARLFPAGDIVLPPSPEDEFADAPERNRVLAEILRWDAADADRLREAVAIYYAMTRFVDDQVGRIVDALDRLALTDKTIVAFVADHGDFGGEHRMLSKGGVFYDCLTRIPMIVAGTGVRAPGTRVAAPVSLIDLVPTILALQGHDLPAGLDGRPLPGATAEPPRDVVFSEYGCGGPRYTMADHAKRAHRHGQRALLDTLLKREYEGARSMVTDGVWKLVHDPMGDSDELYHLAEDPWELRNLAHHRTQYGRVEELRARIGAWRAMC
jgi:arylsulfatase A-like enzyme